MVTLRRWVVASLATKLQSPIAPKRLNRSEPNLYQLVELDEYYNFVIMTFDLKGQSQGQKVKRLTFYGKSRLGSLKMFLLLQFSTECIGLLPSGRP